MKLFLHGVPDSPAIWRPLLRELALPDDQYLVPSLPGFSEALPAGFSATKEAYVTWVIQEMEAAAARHGPLDVIGHDWGALIVQRASMLRPDLVRSWVLMNAVIDPEYRGHKVARIWNTPIIGEIFMALARPGRLALSLIEAGVPTDIAQEEAALWMLPDKRRAILKLYRSAAGLSFADNWALDIPKMPRNGALIWGENDPYVPVEVAQRSARSMDIPLFTVVGAGHWAIAERPVDVAKQLMYFWTSLQN